MEFPISRVRLQKYRVNEAKTVEIKKRVKKELETICKGIEEKVSTTDGRDYAYAITEYVKFGDSGLFYSPANLVRTDGFLKELLEAIKETFPDCTIKVNAQESYIFIDWS